MYIIIMGDLSNVNELEKLRVGRILPGLNLAELSVDRGYTRPRGKDFW